MMAWSLLNKRKELLNQDHMRLRRKQVRKLISFQTYQKIYKVYKMNSIKNMIRDGSVLIKLFIKQRQKLFSTIQSMLLNNRSSNVKQNDRGKSVGCNLFGFNREIRNIQAKFMEPLNKPLLSNICKPKNQNEYKYQITKPQQQYSQIVQKRVMKQNINPVYSRISDKQTEITQKKNFVQTRICKIRGLNNIGNTCYMNSILQCLLNLSKFNSEFSNQLKYFKSSKLQVSVQYSSLVEEFIQNYSSSSFAPSRLKTAIGRKKCRFLGSAQQDAQQFLTAFLQIVNEQMSRIKQKPKYVQLQNDPNKRSIKTLSKQWWDYYKLRDDSIIVDHFQGQLISIVTCKKCKNQSVTFDNIWGLPLSLSKSTYSVNDLIANNWSVQNQITDYYCSICKRHRDCTKKSQFFKLPQILVIQLKRFEYGKWRKQKIKTPIKLTQKLNLSQYLNKHAQSQTHEYRLSGMVHHYGEVDYGHYTASAYKQNEKRWYLLNDSKASESTPESPNNTVYLLFYVKV